MQRIDITRVGSWLRRYGKRYIRHENGWMDDCQMIDDCVYDLGLADHRREIGRMVDDYIREHS